jgi:hypothetical protein
MTHHCTRPEGKAHYGPRQIQPRRERLTLPKGQSQSVATGLWWNVAGLGGCDRGVEVMAWSHSGEVDGQLIYFAQGLASMEYVSQLCLFVRSQHVSGAHHQHGHLARRRRGHGSRAGRRRAVLSTVQLSLLPLIASSLGAGQPTAARNASPVVAMSAALRAHGRPVPAPRSRRRQSAILSDLFA